MPILSILWVSEIPFCKMCAVDVWSPMSLKAILHVSQIAGKIRQKLILDFFHFILSRNSTRIVQSSAHVHPSALKQITSNVANVRTSTCQYLLEFTKSKLLISLSATSFKQTIPDKSESILPHKSINDKQIFIA